jgi:adenylate kinase family enzyme
MKIIFLYGLPACGKLTIAKELSSMVGFKLFHNHLVVDTVLSVFDFGSRPFVELREKFWLDIFKAACDQQDQIKGIIFTFSPDSTVSSHYVDDVLSLIGKYEGVSIDFVQVFCPKEVLLTRVASESRKTYKKLADEQLFSVLLENGSFVTTNLPEPVFTLDSSLVDPAEAARQIAGHLRLELTT